MRCCPHANARLYCVCLAVEAGYRRQADFDVNFGGANVGVGYAFTPTISARLEARKPSSDSSNVAASLSLTF